MPVRASPSLQVLGEGFGAWESWLRTHQNDHKQAALASKTTLPILDPVDMEDAESRAKWLEAHAQAHDDVNAYLRIAGADLTELDWDNPRQVSAWIDLNYLEHQQWSNSLK